MNVALTAGGRIGGAYAASAGTDVKALAPVGGTTMLAKAIAAVRGAGASRIAVVGGSAVRAACGDEADRVVDESASGGENLLRALRVWPEDEPLLLMTTDLPFVDAPSLRRFLDAVPAGSFAMPLTSSEAFEARFPEAPPYGIAFAGERVVNGGAFWFPAGAVGPVARVATAFFEARKSPWRMASLLGPGLALRFLAKRLTIASLEADALRRFGFPAIAVRDCAAELCFDADGIEEYRYALGRA